MIRILYDGEIFSLQPVGGVNRYFTSLISSLPENITPIVLSSKGSDRSPNHPNIKWASFSRFAFRPGRLAFLVEQFYFGTIAKLSRPDLIHPTYYYLLLGRALAYQKKPIVVTLYDMIHEIYPNIVDPLGHHAAAKKEILKAATHIICISNRTMRDLLELYPCYEKKCSVIPLSPDEKLAVSARACRPIEQPYFLYVGQRRSYKNFITLLNAFKNFVKKFPEVRLLVSGPALEYGEIEQISKLGLHDKVVYMGVSIDADLSTLYRHSVALVYPSLYEGFGLPPLEAMLCGAPTICSSSSSIPEVVGDASILFDPRSEEDLQTSLSRVYQDTNLQDRLRKRGYERVKLYTTNRMVSSTVRLYESLI